MNCQTDQSDQSDIQLQQKKVSNKEVLTFLKSSYPNENVSIDKIEYSLQENIGISYINYSINGKDYHDLAFAKGEGKIILRNKEFNLHESLGAISISCPGNCAGSGAKCRVTGYYDPATNTNVLECSCEGCEMKINQL